MWFGQTGLNVNRFETGLSASVNGAYVMQCEISLILIGVWRGMLNAKKSCGDSGTKYQISIEGLW